VDRAKRGAFIPLPLLVCLAAGAPQGPPAAGEGAISVDVNLVVLHAAVTDRRGHSVSGLGEPDFQVFEDGIPQKIKLFAHEDLPVAAGLAVDHSGSMHSKLAEVSAAAGAFVEASNPGDQVFVVNFNENVELGLPPSLRFSNDPIQLESAISRVPASGKTALYDAISLGLQVLSEGAPNKKVLLVISDGGDNASKHTLAQTLALAEQSSVIIYTVGIFDADDPDQNPGVLRRLARATGGLAFFPSEPKQVSAICTRIAHDIRDQYTIAYSPSHPAKPGEYRTIRVAASAPHQGKLIVRTRSGYLAGAEAGSPK
jgi:Ca-activated chloride channel homolog